MGQEQLTPRESVDQLGAMEDMAAEADMVLDGAMREMRRQALVPMLVRSAMFGLILFWLSTKFGWVRWLFWMWAAFTVFMLGVIVALPQIIQSRVRTMTRGAREAMDLAGEAGMFSDEGDIVDLDHTEPVDLMDQLAHFEELGLPLADGKTQDDVEDRLDKEAFEDEPYALLLYTLGTPGAGGVLCDRALTVDAKCIQGPGSYADLVTDFARISGKAARVTSAADSVDLEGGTATLSFEFDGNPRSMEPEVNDEWVDEAVLKEIVELFADESHGFYGIQNGRFSAVVYLDRDDAELFADLMPGEVAKIA